MLNNLKMNKKAVSIIMMIFEIVVVISIVFLMVKVARVFGSSEGITSINIAEDISMMIDAFVGLPGDAKVLYPVNISKFTLLVNGESVFVTVNGNPKIMKTVRKFHLPPSYSALGSVEGVEKDVEITKYACIEKQGQTIFLKECTPEEVHELQVVSIEGLCFPVTEESFRLDLNDFGSRRGEGERCHVGNDLLTKEPGEVVAIADGVVAAIGNFKTCVDPQNWGLAKESLTEGKTMQLLVYHPEYDVTVNYGEVDHNKIKVSVGDAVKKGQVIAVASYCGMLHFELYGGRRMENIRWIPSSEVPAGDKNYCVSNYWDDKDSAIRNPRAALAQGKFCPAPDGLVS